MPSVTIVCARCTLANHVSDRYLRGLWSADGVVATRRRGGERRARAVRDAPSPPIPT